MKKNGLAFLASMLFIASVQCKVVEPFCDPIDPGCSDFGLLTWFYLIIPLPVSIANLHENNVVHTGFLVGTAGEKNSLAGVEVSIDGGAYTAATGTTSWSYKLPSGTSTWRPGTRHTIAVRSRDTSGNSSEIASITVRKGVNRDVNGDGYADVIVGAHGYNAGQGQAYIFHSAGSSGISTAGAASADAILTGESGGDCFGGSFALGDINGDGYADVIVGAYCRNAGAGANQGQVYMFHSAGGSGISTTGAASADATLTGESGGDYFGFSLALGDISGNGHADAIVGALYHNAGAGAYQGQAYVFHSAGGSGIATTGAASADAKLTGESGGDTFGTSVALGDISGDGYADALVGALGHNAGAGADQGRAYVFHSDGGSGIATAGAASADAILTGENGNDWFGSFLTLGDISGDGYADALVEAAGYNAASGQGRAYVFHSTGGSGIATTGAASADAILTGESGGDYFSFWLALGDINGDGYADAIVGANGYNAGAGANQGQVYLFHSTGSSGISTTGAASADTILTGESGGDDFGGSVALWDINGDGYADAIVGANGYNAGAGADQGQVYLFHSAGSSGISTTGAASADAKLTGENGSDNYGICVGL